MTPESQPSNPKTQELMDYRVDPLRTFAIGIKKGKKTRLYYAKWKHHSVDFPEGEHISLLPVVADGSIDVGINILNEALEHLNDIFTGQDLILRFSAINSAHEPTKTMLEIDAFRSDGELVARVYIAGRTDLTGRVL